MENTTSSNNGSWIMHSEELVPDTKNDERHEQMAVKEDPYGFFPDASF